MGLSSRILFPGLLTFLFTAALLSAEPGDVENSHDYAAFPRLPGFVISGYDEDNPADFDFQVARPLPIDSGNVETVAVKGHRYIIHYELGAGGKPLSLLQTQRAYEKQAAAAGFTIEKTGAVGDITETFIQRKAGQTVWVCLEPGAATNILTIMESGEAPPPAPQVAAGPPEPPASPAPAPVVAKPTPTPPPAPPVVAAKPTPPLPPPPEKPAPTPSLTVNDSEDALYAALMKNGHVALPLTFLPGKPDIDADSQPVIDRVIAMLKAHPEMMIEIDGHTDNYGSASQNEYVSTQRALTVRGMLVAGQISKKRLTAVGMGGAKPVASNGTSEGRAKNRRIELVLKKTTPKKTTSSADSASNSSTQDGSNTAPFHATAPNGKNYYPDKEESSSTSSNFSN